jgi:hypothetical protein
MDIYDEEDRDDMEDSGALNFDDVGFMIGYCET